MNTNENRFNHADPEASEPAETGTLRLTDEMAFDQFEAVVFSSELPLGDVTPIALKQSPGCGAPDSAAPETQKGASSDPGPMDGSQKERQPQDGPEESGELFCDSDPTLWLYRDRTAGLLRRYFRFSIEVGRLPSLLGREFFRTRVTSYRVGTFEDAVIFVSDVERCLDQLDDEELDLISSIVFEDFTHEKAALLMQCRRRTLGRRLPDALDRLTELFLESAILLPFPTKFSKRENACQEAKTTQIPLSDCEQGKNKFPNFDQSP